MQGDRNNISQALYQLAGMGVALGSAIVGGFVTGNKEWYPLGNTL